jgi:hypothetical protein
MTFDEGVSFSGSARNLPNYYAFLVMVSSSGWLTPALLCLMLSGSSCFYELYKIRASVIDLHYFATTTASL